MRTIIINKLAGSLRIVPVFFAFAFALIAEARVVHEYTVSVEPELDSLRVEARFAFPVNDVRARSDDAHRYINEVRDCKTSAAISHRGRRLSIPRAGTTCLSYMVNLDSAAAADRRNRVLAPENVVVSPTVWMWRPALDSEARIVVHFELHRDHRVSVPWRPIDGARDTYEILPSPRNARAPAAFGEFHEAGESLAGAKLRIAVLKPLGNIDADAIVEWIRGTARNISLAYGRFPNPSPQIIVIPVGQSEWQSDSPVPFGRVLRDGGESVELFINESMPMTAFYDDWTATHEFSHLMLPYLRSPHRWVSEGFAQYYQNVLLARAGQYDELRAWQKLYEGFERGRRSRPELSPNEAARLGVGRATMKIYWSGAVLALLADVELRRRSGGRESLDAVLDQLQQCCLPAANSWSATQLFERLDSFVDEPVFTPLYRRYANEPGFPDIGPVFARLGLDVIDGRVVLHNDAELAGIRKAITDIY